MAQAGQPQLLKQYNTSLIQNLILEKGPITKPELAHLTSLSLPTVNKIVDELVKEKFAVEDSFQTGTGAGRKAKTYVVNGKYGTFLAVYYQNGRWTGCTVNILGEVLVRMECNAFSDTHGEQIQILLSFLKELKDSSARVKAIGIGIPGIVTNSDEIEGIPSLPELEGVNLKSILEERFELPVFIENDVKLMTVGYHSLKMNNLENIVFLYIGSGIGAGVMINGQLYKGNTSFAGEFGYMPALSEETDTPGKMGGSLELRVAALKKEQMEHPNLSGYREALSKEVARALVGCVAVINPEAVVLYCDDLDKEALAILKKELGRYLPKNCIPQLCLTSNKNYGMSGLIHLCQDGISKKNRVFDTL